MRQVHERIEAFVRWWDHLPIGLCVLDADFQVLYWNRCLELWTGREREHVLAQDIGTYFHRFRERQYRDRMSFTFANGTPIVFSYQLHPDLFSDAPGVPNSRALRATVTAIPKEEAQGYWALVVVENVTELNQRIEQYRAMHKRALEEMAAREEALAEIRVLSGLLPICCVCKSVRDDRGYWHQVEAYIAKHSEASFSHGICPKCQHRMYPEFFPVEETES